MQLPIFNYAHIYIHRIEQNKKKKHIRFGANRYFFSFTAPKLKTVPKYVHSSEYFPISNR
jgi:hypothetical protein